MTDLTKLLAVGLVETPELKNRYLFSHRVCFVFSFRRKLFLPSQRLNQRTKGQEWKNIKVSLVLVIIVCLSAGNSFSHTLT